MLRNCGLPPCRRRMQGRDLNNHRQDSAHCNPFMDRHEGILCPYKPQGCRFPR
jgi:hypothetical protein